MAASKKRLTKNHGLQVHEEAKKTALVAAWMAATQLGEPTLYWPRLPVSEKSSLVEKGT